jgi:hypothetical protein
MQILLIRRLDSPKISGVKLRRFRFRVGSRPEAIGYSDANVRFPETSDMRRSSMVAAPLTQLSVQKRSTSPEDGWQRC